MIVITAVERQFDDLSLIDHRAPAGRFALENGGFRGNVHLLSQSAHRQLYVQARGLVHLQHHAG